MEFQKERVFTAVNADELKVGSKVYVADNLGDLKITVTHEESRYFKVIDDKEGLTGMLRNMFYCGVRAREILKEVVSFYPSSTASIYDKAYEFLNEV